MRTALDTKEKRLAQRFKPEGATVIDDGYCLAYLYNGKENKPAALGYHGTSSKPDFHFRFNTLEDRQKHIDNWQQKFIAYRQLVDNRKQERLNFKNPFKVGDILDSSWGYDQTNIDFYQVLSTTDKTVTIQKICQNVEQTLDMQGTCTPRPNEFAKNSAPHTHKVTGNYIHLTSYSSASLWDGKPRHYTEYA